MGGCLQKLFAVTTPHRNSLCFVHVSTLDNYFGNRSVGRVPNMSARHRSYGLGSNTKSLNSQVSQRLLGLILVTVWGSCLVLPGARRGVAWCSAPTIRRCSGSALRMLESRGCQGSEVGLQMSCVLGSRIDHDSVRNMSCWIRRLFLF